MSVWSISISSAAFLVSIISFCYARRAWSESNRPLVTARITSLGMGGNAAVPLTIVVENTGNRPAKNIRLKANRQHLISAFAADESDGLRRQVEICFSEQGLIPVIANGKQVSNSFGIVSHDRCTWNTDRLGIEICYEDLDGRSFTHKLPLKMGEDTGFASGFWQLSE